LGTTPDLLNLFVEPSIALIYYLLVILLGAVSMFMALGQRLRGPMERSAGRYAVASVGVMLSWIALMIGGMVVLVTRRPPATILPPLDRAVSTMVVLLVGWAFLTADQQPTRAGQRPGGGWLTVLVALLVLATIGAYIYTAAQWYETSGAEFNRSVYGIGWMIGITVLSALGLLLHILRFRSTVDAPIKILFFVLLLAGSGYTLYNMFTGALGGDDVGALRLAFLAAMIFLPIIVYRLVIDRLLAMVESESNKAVQNSLSALTTPTPSPALEMAAEREASTLLRALGTMIDNEQPDNLPQQIVISAANVLKADVVALLVLDDAEYADVIAAWDNIQQKSIAAMALKLDEQPTLQSAISYNAQQALSAGRDVSEIRDLYATQQALTTDKNLNELVDLYTRLDVQKIGPAYFQPLMRDGNPIGLLVVGLPYTQRELRENETRLLEALAPIAARLLAISRTAQRTRFESQDRAVQAVVEGAQTDTTPLPAVRADMQASLELARKQISELSLLVRDLQIELDYERGRLAELGMNDPEGLSITQRLAKMSAERSQLEIEREKLMQALQEAQAKLATASGSDDEVYEAMVRVLQQERDELQNQKAQLEAQIAEIRAHGQAPTPAALRDILTSLSEEKARLAVERDQIKDQLTEVEAELRALGVEGGAAGLASVILQLTNERSQYKAQAERAAQDRDTLLAERNRIRDLIANEAKRTQRITALETALRRLAADREALLQQRNSLRQERETVGIDRAEWETQRAKMVADLGALQAELEEAIFDRNRAIAERDKLAEARASLETERDRLIAERTALRTERDQMMARVVGNRETLQQLGDEGIGALKSMINDLTEERSDLAHKLVQAQTTIQSLEERLSKAEAHLAQSVHLPVGTPLDASQAEIMLSIAKDLRTPLGSMLGYIDLLISESVGVLGASQHEFLKRVKANADRLGKMVEDFVHVTAIDTGQLNLHPKDLDMIGIIEDSITATRDQFAEKQIQLNINLPDTLPSIKGDPDALQQVMVQLLSNAFMASPNDSPVTVAAKYERRLHLPPHVANGAEMSDVIFVSVRDSGGGIPAEEQKRIFSRLYRADNPLVQGLGDTGVGLSIARALVEAHGGRIWVESSIGVGSTFKFAVPLQAAMRSERVAHAAS
jgi:signal transduction histidine kinase